MKSYSLGISCALIAMGLFASNLYANPICSLKTVITKTSAQVVQANQTDNPLRLQIDFHVDFAIVGKGLKGPVSSLYIIKPAYETVSGYTNLVTYRQMDLIDNNKTCSLPRVVANIWESTPYNPTFPLSASEYIGGKMARIGSGPQSSTINGLNSWTGKGNDAGVITLQNILPAPGERFYYAVPVEIKLVAEGECLNGESDSDYLFEDRSLVFYMERNARNFALDIGVVGEGFPFN